MPAVLAVADGFANVISHARAADTAASVADPTIRVAIQLATACLTDTSNFVGIHVIGTIGGLRPKVVAPTLIAAIPRSGGGRVCAARQEEGEQAAGEGDDVAHASAGPAEAGAAASAAYGSAERGLAAVILTGWARCGAAPSPPALKGCTA